MTIEIDKNMFMSKKLAVTNKIWGDMYWGTKSSIKLKTKIEIVP
jgi:hypothetical protein